MNQHIPEIRIIISELNVTFTSHAFLKKFAKRFERDYINLLNEHNGNEAFRKVHSQIAKFLSVNETTFRIVKTSKEPSENIFGEIDEIQAWKKV